MESKDTAKYELGQKIFKIDIARVSNVVSHSQGKIYKSRVKTASLYSTLTFKLKTAVSSSEKSTSINVNFKNFLNQPMLKFVGQLNVLHHNFPSVCALALMIYSEKCLV